MFPRWRKRLATLLKGPPLRRVFMVALCFVLLNMAYNTQTLKRLLIHSPPDSRRLYTNVYGNLSSLDPLFFNISSSSESDHEPLPEVNYNVYQRISPNVTKSCPLISPLLKGRVEVNATNLPWSELQSKYPQIQGGLWRPSNCIPIESVAVVIPYRKREMHLRVLLNNLHPILQRQQRDYGIFVVEQTEHTSFNRASLFNIGFLEALKVHNFSCFVFHDVDLLPEDDRTLYQCGSNPRHLSAAVDKFNYKLLYVDLFGGVGTISRDQFYHINGFSNLYFGWGGEDDDMAYRLKHHGLKVTRYPLWLSRYKMIRHVHDSGNTPNPLRFQLLKSAVAREHIDGVRQVNYSLTSALPQDLVFWIKASLPEDEVLALWPQYFHARSYTVIYIVVGVYLSIALVLVLLICRYCCDNL